MTGLRSRARQSSFVVAAAIIATFLFSGTAYADYDPPPPGTDVYVGPCNLIACELWASRSYTKQVLAPAAPAGATGYTAVVTGMCALSGVGAAVSTGCASYSGFLASVSAAAIAQAEKNNQCAVLVSEQVVNVLSWFRTDNSSYCID